jgi:hypothetical protein
MTALEAFQSLLKVVEHGEIRTARGRPGPQRAFGIGPIGITVHGENVAIFNACIDVLYKSNASVFATYTREPFEKHVVALLESKIIAGNGINRAACDEFFKELQAVPIARYSTYRAVDGLKLRSVSAPYRIGPFTIYHHPSHRHLIDSRSDDGEELLFDGSDVPEYLIQVETSARDFDKASELADLMFEKFELTLQFMIGFGNDSFEVGVMHHRGLRKRASYTIDENGWVGSRHQWLGPLQSINIDDPYFQGPERAFDRAWTWVGDEHASELQRRLALAIEWAGQSYSEVSPASAFLKSAIALEIIFAHNEKTLISASILSQISESVAMLLGKDVEERLEIEATVKKLYSTRSAIAHAGKNQISRSDLHHMFRVTRSVIAKLITGEPFREMTSVAQVHEHLKRCKYAVRQL